MANKKFSCQRGEQGQPKQGWGTWEIALRNEKSPLKWQKFLRGSFRSQNESNRGTWGKVGVKRLINA